jgi:type I restriction enzyme S subunit
VSEALRTLSAQPLRRFKSYPAYKDSGVEWLGEIPLGWKPFWLGRLGSFSASGIDKKTVEGEAHVSMVNYTDVYSNTSRTLDRAREYMRTTCPGQKAIEHSLRCGDILFTPSSETEEEVGFSAVVTEDMPGTVYSYHLIRFRPGAHADLNTAFSKYFCNNTVVLSQFSAACKGTTRQILTREDFKRIGVVLPPLPEQRAIAAFLDRETARIDALVAKKERLIELLQEKRTALITRAVTKGLDPTVPMKDSGVEWLGEIPAHWEVKRLWHLTPARRRIMYGIVLPGPNVDDGVPIVKGGDVSPGRLRLSSLNRTTREIEASYVRSRLQGGDLVYAIRGSIGEVAMVPAELTGANLTQDAARVAYTPATHGPWLLYALKSRAVFAQLEAGALGATIRGINIRDLKRASLAVPPAVEQQAIAKCLDHETARFDALIAKVRDAIDRLEELRTALISAAVTGKIDVREEAA